MTPEEAAAPVSGVHHLTLRVSDLQRSRWFYEGVLGFEVDQDFDDKVRLRLGAGPGSSRLVLRPPLPGSPAGDRFDEHGVGLDHVAVTVECLAQLERTVEALRAAGVATEGAQPSPGGGALVAFRDPDNIQWEFFAD